MKTIPEFCIELCCSAAFRTIVILLPGAAAAIKLALFLRRLLALILSSCRKTVQPRAVPIQRYLSLILLQASSETEIDLYNLIPVMIPENDYSAD
jgi:hypothetical protein